MITYRNIGMNGRLGNTLYEIAATIGIGLDHDQDVIFPEGWMYQPYFSIPDSMFGVVPPDAHEATEYAEHIDVRARSYLQDINLFWPYMDVIRDYFHPSALAFDVLDQYVLPEPGSRLGVHVRRGDNVVDPGVPNKSDYHLCPSLDYYERGIYHFAIQPESYDYLAVFSDDVSWCRENFPTAAYFGDGRAYWKEHEQRYGLDTPYDWIDLFLLSQCDRFVLSGSTFGNWAAFLSMVEPDDVLRPSKVYGPLLDHINSELLFDPEWGILQCS